MLVQSLVMSDVCVDSDVRIDLRLKFSWWLMER